MGAAAAGLLAACTARAPGEQARSLNAALPGTGAVAGWTAPEAARAYTEKDLFELVNGQAESYFAYGFIAVAARRYQAGDGNQIQVEVWQLASPGDAYGLYLASRSGQPAAGLGMEGALESGRRAAFWQERLYVTVTANRAVDDAVLRGFAEKVNAALPSGGERPALLQRLPAEGREAGSELYFHQEISLQNLAWLGGENLLGLSARTACAAARYSLEAQPAVLIVVAYESADEAAKGLAAAQSGRVDQVAAAQVKGSLLAMVIGTVSAQSAAELAGRALQ